MANGNILVAEDDQVAQMVLGNLFERAGYKVDFTDDGREAISALKLKDYDLVVMDCLMPEMDGFEAARFIRSGISNDIDADIPIIALTGLSTKDDINKCREAGMNSHVNKPVDPRELITAIEQYLGSAPEGVSTRFEDAKFGEHVWDDAFLATIIDKFLADVPEVLRELHQAVERGDLIRLRQLGHRLRGAADILGTTTLSDRACALEQAENTADIKHMSKLALELTGELQKLTTVLTD